MFNSLKKSAKTTIQKMLHEEDYKTPMVGIKMEALMKMSAYVSISQIEFGWLCASMRLQDNNFYIYETFCCQQENSGVSSDLREEGLQELAQRLIKEGREDELSNIRTWGHSHVDMQISPSVQDDETFEEYYKNCDYFIRIIMNKKNEICIDVADTERGVIYYDVDWFVLEPEELQIMKTDYEIAANNLKEMKDAIDAIYAAAEEEAETTAKEEYAKYVTKESFLYHAGEKLHSPAYGYEDYEDEYMYAQYYNECAKISVKIGGQIYREYIDEILDEDELYDLYGLDADDLKKKLQKDDRFKHYSKEDWKDLEWALYFVANEYGLCKYTGGTAA